MNLSLITRTIPECPGFYNWMPKPLVMTNEVYQPVFEKLRNKPLEGNLMIAVSGLYALNLFAVRRNLDCLLLIDREDRVRSFWSEIKIIIIESDNRNTVFKKISYMFRGFSENDTLAQPNITWLQEEVDQGLSWLSNEDTFLRIKHLFQANRIFFKQLDLCDPEPLRQLAFYLKVHNLSVDLIYLSDEAEQAKMERKLTLFTKGVSHLLSPSSYIVESIAGHQHLKQRGAEPLRNILFKPN